MFRKHNSRMDTMREARPNQPPILAHRQAIAALLSVHPTLSTATRRLRLCLDSRGSRQAYTF